MKNETCKDEESDNKRNRWDLRVEIPPKDWFWDINTKEEVITPRAADKSFTNFVQLATTYLWIGVIVALLLTILYAWFKLVTSRWDPEAFSSANKVLLYAAIWFGIALLAYVIVNIVVNVFE